ncbi:MAG: VOC family protein [Planctomycetales bacterium]|nr:VOC family protein [Planctomycetales bacterium]
MRGPARPRRGGSSTEKITACLWFDNQAEEAARFYASIFRNSKVGKITRYPEGAPGPKGSVMTVSVRLDGQDFLLLNGGPVFKFSEAVSFIVNCATQKELDRMWERLSEGGQQVQCGWLKDRFGVSWQVIPTVLQKMLADRDPARIERVFQAVLGMKKIEIGDLKRAYARRT